MLLIEVDGYWAHTTPTAFEEDPRRRNLLVGLGYMVRTLHAQAGAQSSPCGCRGDRLLAAASLRRLTNLGRERVADDAISTEERWGGVRGVGSAAEEAVEELDAPGRASGAGLDAVRAAREPRRGRGGRASATAPAPSRVRVVAPTGGARSACRRPVIRSASVRPARFVVATPSPTYPPAHALPDAPVVAARRIPVARDAERPAPGVGDARARGSRATSVGEDAAEVDEHRTRRGRTRVGSSDPKWYGAPRPPNAMRSSAVRCP